MKVKFLESAAIGGDEIYAKGQIADLDTDQAKRQIASGAAAPYDDADVQTAIQDLSEVRKAVKKRS